jgi:hypothetical protein
LHSQPAQILIEKTSFEVCKLFGTPINDENKSNAILSSPKKKNQGDAVVINTLLEN